MSKTLDPDRASAERRTLWQKGAAPDDWVIRYTVGDDYKWDTELLPFDVRATRAHADGLRRIGVLDASEFQLLADTLDELLRNWEEGKVEVEFRDEDCHTVVERFLTDRAGSVGGKVHTGRSRNDQVLAALRLFERDTLRSLASDTVDLASSLLDRASEGDRWLMPGHTHTQRAMPSTVGLWAAGYAETLLYDADELIHAAHRTNRSPLGSGAGYGIPHIALDREGVAQELFDGYLIHNSTAVQLGRGKVEMVAVGAAAQLALTLNRMSADLTLFASSEFGFIEFPDFVATGSSIMPHKKNPDVLEIARASYHRVAAELNLLMSLTANLTSGYHRDLQLTKGATMRALGLVGETTRALADFVPYVTFNRERLDAAVSNEMLTASNALRDARGGRPFREAYRENEAAAERPSAEEILSTYPTPGSPGRLALAPLSEHVGRITAELARHR